MTVLRHPNLPGVTYETHEAAVPVWERVGWRRVLESEASELGLTQSQAEKLADQYFAVPPSAAADVAVPEPAADVAAEPESHPQNPNPGRAARSSRSNEKE